MACVIGIVVMLIVLLVLWGPERRGVPMADAQRGCVASRIRMRRLRIHA